MYALLTVSKRLKKWVPSAKKRYSMKEATVLLSELDRKVEEEQLTESVVLSLYNKKELLFKDEYVLGNKRARNLLLMVKETLDTTFSTKPETEKKELMSLIQHELTALPEKDESLLNEVKVSDDLTKDPTKRSLKGFNRHWLKPNGVSDTDVSKEKVTPVLAVHAEEPVGSVPETKKGTAKRKHTPFLFGVVIVLGIALMVYQVSNIVSKSQSVALVETTNQLTESANKTDKSDKVTSTGNKTSREDVEKEVRSLVKASKYDEVVALNKKTPTPLGMFEVAFYEEDWESVTKIPLDKLTDEQQGMIAMAHIELGQLDEAELLNKGVKSDEVERAIHNRYLNQGLELIRAKQMEQAEVIQQKLKDVTFDKYVSDAKAYLSLIKWYEEKGDTMSVEQWNRIIESIGT